LLPYSKVPPPKEGRFGPKFPDPRALPMRGDFFPYKGALRAPENDPRALPARGLRALPLGGGLYCTFRHHRSRGPARPRLSSSKTNLVVKIMSVKGFKKKKWKSWFKS